MARPLRPSDRGPIQRILEATEAFTAVEIETALSLLDESFAKPDGPDPYRFIVATSLEDSSEVLGYVCFGSTPLTRGTYDLYWIAVDPKAQGGGVGRALVDRVTAAIRAEGARLLLIETSSREDYSKTRDFYARAGFTVEARISDFYAPGDDRVIYSRRF